MGGRSRIGSGVLLLVGFALGFGPSGCGGESGSHGGTGRSSSPSALAHVGEPCVPNEELKPSHDGASIEELWLTTSSTPSCELCIANHFRGRVTCPYGQTSEDLAQGTPRCFVPGSSTPVTVPVPPGVVDRPASKVVTCSCRCAGPGPGPFCTCPTGTECVELVVDLGLPDTSQVGSYCVLPNTKYDPTSNPGATCDESSLNCGAAHPE